MANDAPPANQYQVQMVEVPEPREAAPMVEKLPQEPKEPMTNQGPQVEKWLRTRYAAPAEYDTNNDGVLDAKEREVAEADGNLQIDSIAVIQNPAVGDGVIEEARFTNERTNSAPGSRRRRKRKTSRRRRRTRR